VSLLSISSWCIILTTYSSVSVDVDYKDWATRKDLDNTKTHSPANNIGKMRMPKIQKRKGQPLFTPQAVNGLVVEDSQGVPLIYHVTRVLEPEVQVSVIIRP